MLELSSKERADYRRSVKTAKPHLVVGKRGLTPTLLAEAETALKKSPVIKVRFQGHPREALAALVSALVEGTQAAHCGTTGFTAVFYRPAQD